MIIKKTFVHRFRVCRWNKHKPTFFHQQMDQSEIWKNRDRAGKLDEWISKTHGPFLGKRYLRLERWRHRWYVQFQGALYTNRVFESICVSYVFYLIHLRILSMFCFNKKPPIVSGIFKGPPKMGPLYGKFPILFPYHSHKNPIIFPQDPV